MIIAISGPDGSGKSTLFEHIRGKHPEWSLADEFEYKVLRPFKRKQGPLVGSTREASVISAYAYLMADILETFVMKLRRRKVYVKDRCAYDHYLTGIELGGSKIIFRALIKIAPKPDLLIYLNHDTEELINRRSAQHGKKSKAPEFYKKRSLQYSAFFDDIKCVKIINQELAQTAKIADFNINLMHSILNHRFMAISGVDGSGKTTAIESVAEYLDSIGVKVKVVHFYYNYILLKILRAIKLTKSNIESTETQKKSIEHEKKAATAGKSKLWQYVVLSDALVQYFSTRLWHRKKFIIYDRFFIDFQVSFIFLGIKNSLPIIEKLPRAPIHVLLSGNPRSLYERKPEHTLAFFQECIQLYDKLSKRFSLKKIDTITHDASQTKDKIMETIS